MTITNRLKTTLTPLRLHSASSVRIPNSINNFRTLKLKKKQKNERQAFFTSEDTKRYKLWSCQNVREALIYLLDNIYIRFGTKLYRQIVGIPMGTNCAPLVASCHFGHLLQVSKKSLWSLILYFFYDFIHYIAPGRGQTVPRGQSFDVNKQVLSLHSFVASLKKKKKNFLTSDFIHFFFFFFII